ncbi:MAG: hypothetical protein IPF44_00855 [Betaproteobacteria bacterium]|nr:hypothetical protein [Betaproteobacteria bacterium]
MALPPASKFDIAACGPLKNGEMPASIDAGIFILARRDGRLFRPLAMRQRIRQGATRPLVMR